MPQKSIIIIGGGIAGLSAGCYGQMNGFNTRIFEMHKKKPGGLCTAWKRQGYTVNGCLHWLAGSSPGSPLYTMWEELGAVQDRRFVYPEEYARIEVQGKTFIVHTDLEKLERHMKDIAPEDGAVIDELIGAVRRAIRMDMPVGKAPEVSTLLDGLMMIIRNIPLLMMLWKWNKVSLTDFGKRFKSPLIRVAFPLLFMPDFPMTFMIMTMAWMHNRSAGYPLGGSLEFSRSIEQRYLALGGEMNYRSRVVQILTENDRAVGIRLEDGTEHHADHVISAADGHATIFDMLGGRYLDDRVRGYYETLLPFPPIVHVALGVDMPFGELPWSIGGMAWALDAPIMIGGVEQKVLGAHVYNFDPTLAPPGKTLVTVIFPTEFEYWKKLHENDASYRAEKDSVADLVVSHLDKRFPGLAQHVEMRDVATPTTFVRYTGNWKGSFEGWQVTPRTWSIGRVMRKTLPGLENFYLAGQWVEPGGGVPAVALCGRNVIQIICKKENKKFTSTIPGVVVPSDTRV